MVKTSLQGSLLGTELKVFSVVRDPQGLSKVGMLCLIVLLPSFLPGVCSSARMAAACTAASRIRYACTAGSQSAALMWSWSTGEK